MVTYADLRLHENRQRLSIRDRHEESGGIQMPKLHCGNGWLYDSAHLLRSLNMDTMGELHIYKYSFFKEGKGRQHTEKPEEEWPTTFWWFCISHMGSSCLIIFLSRVIFLSDKKSTIYVYCFCTWKFLLAKKKRKISNIILPHKWISQQLKALPNFRACSSVCAKISCNVLRDHFSLIFALLKKAFLNEL